MSIDFERAKLLMDIVVSAGQHGPMYQKLASEAGKELKAMIDEAELPGDKEALANKERLALQTDQREKNIQAELDLAREHRNSPDVRRKV